MVEIFGDFTFRWGGEVLPPFIIIFFFWQNDFILRGKGERVGCPFIRKKKT
jgi:hypothetical protein